MKIVIDNRVIDTTYFRGCYINDGMRMVIFVCKTRPFEAEIMLPIFFENLPDATRFFKEYHNHHCATDGECVYTFEGEATTCYEIYRRIVERSM